MNEHNIKFNCSQNFDKNTFDRNEYNVLNAKYQPLNLGQGFQDYPVPKYITDALASTANSSNCLMNQYTRGFVSVLLSIENFFLSFSYQRIIQRVIHVWCKPYQISIQN